MIDKWFGLQAMIPQPDGADKVRTLTAHPAFSFANPNRVRALIGAFSRRETRPSSTGPTALAMNSSPTMCWRSIRKIRSWRRGSPPSFRTWRTLEEGRRGKAQAALEHIKAAPNQSRDLADIVERALAAR